VDSTTEAGRDPLPNLEGQSDSPIAIRPQARDALLAKLALYSNPAIWPSVQVALILHDALRLPIAVVAYLTASERTGVARLVSRGRRRIRAFQLVERIAAGSAWPSQLAQIHRFVGRLLELAGKTPRRFPERRSRLAQIAYQLSSYLASHPLAGTPASHELRRRARRQVDSTMLARDFLASGEHLAAG
jgi:hypothetical protein